MTIFQLSETPYKEMWSSVRIFGPLFTPSGPHSFLVDGLSITLKKTTTYYHIRVLYVYIITFDVKFNF